MTTRPVFYRFRHKWSWEIGEWDYRYFGELPGDGRISQEDLDALREDLKQVDSPGA